MLWRRQEAPGGTTGTCKSGLETVGRRTRRAAAGRHSRLSPSGQPRHHSLCRIAIASRHHSSIYTTPLRIYSAQFAIDYRSRRSILIMYTLCLLCRGAPLLIRVKVSHVALLHRSFGELCIRISFESD